MEFRILGCLEAESGGRCLPLGGPLDQKLLAALLLEAGRVVPVARLVDVLWAQDPPVTGVKQVRNAVSRLRLVLAAGGAPGLIVTSGAGYRLAVAGDALDTRLFEARVRLAGHAASEGRVSDAARLLRSALGLCRGPVLAGMTGAVIEAAAAVWEERRCAALEALFDHELALGRHREAVADLRAFAGEHPLRDKPAGQLMLALHRCGRQADALAWYDKIKAELANDLGLDPSPQLRRLRQQILTNDPAIILRGSAQRRAHTPIAQLPPSVPRQLPCPPSSFSGRAAELAELHDLATRAAGESGEIVIAAVGGMPGIGKTALAVRFAHQVTARFGGGQLYVDLRGFGPAPPLTPEEAIRGFLDALEVPAARIPAGPEAQAGLYRSLLAGRRTLVVADNARDAGHVRPLLPGAGSLILITSRNQLSSLAAADGAHLINLDTPTPAECADMLTARLGQGRVNAEPQAAAQIITRCGQLPAALAITAARAAARPAVPLNTLAAELRDHTLDALTSGDDPATDLREVFSWSYHALTPPAARLFRLLSLHPRPDICTLRAASLTGLPPAPAQRILAELARAHLISEHIPGRYTIHDLLRAYAKEKPGPGNTPPEAGHLAPEPAENLTG